MKISIRWALILGCLGLIWGTQIVITTSTYLTSQKVLIKHARDIMQNIADLTMEQSQNHLALAQGAAHLTKRLISSNVVGSDLDRREILERYFLDQLAIYQHFAGIYVGMPNGDFFYVSRSDDRTAGGFRTKSITHPDGIKETRLIWRDPEQHFLSDEKVAVDAYDPRQRPWYLKALREKKIVWTDPYIFFTSQKPGITIAGPIYDPDEGLIAIVGVDIEIDQLSTFIGRLRIGKHGRAFMLNNNGDVVAFPDPGKLRHSEEGQSGKYRLVKIEELDDGLSQAAYQAVQWQRNDQDRIDLQAARFVRFNYGGENYHAVFTPFADEQWPWIIGVYLPESDYLGAIQENRRFNLMLTLGLSVVATIIGLAMARSVIRPLAGLEKEAQAIKQNRLDRQFDTGSVFKEIQETADSFARMKEDIRRSEEKYRGIFQNIQDVYYEVSLEGRILEISPSIHNVSDYAREELIGAELKQLYQNFQDRKDFLNVILAEGHVSDYEITMTTKAGRIENCSINSSLKRDADGNPEKIVGSLRVITDRKKTELELRRYQERLEDLVHERTRDLEETNRRLLDQMEARKTKEEELRESEEKYRSIIENMDDGYFEVDRQGNLTFFNDRLAEILGYEEHRMEGLNFRKYLEADATEAVKKRFADIWTSGKSQRLARYSIVRPDGQERTLDVSVSLINDQSGNNIGFRGVVIDVSDRLNAEKEKRKLEVRLQQIQRLEGIGTLAGGVAHDFNNIVTGISAYAHMIRTQPQDVGAVVDSADKILMGCDRASDLVHHFLVTAGRRQAEKQQVRLRTVVNEVFKLLQPTCGSHITLDNRVTGEVDSVWAEPALVFQILMNLCVNGVQAMAEDGGVLTLGLKNGMTSDDAQPQAQRVLFVSDQGPGIAPELLDRIFEPFFTTRRQHNGTGIGLFVVS